MSCAQERVNAHGSGNGKSRAKRAQPRAHAMRGLSVSPQTMWQVYGWGMTTTHRLRVSLEGACPPKFGAKRCSTFTRVSRPNLYRCHVISPPPGRVVHPLKAAEATKTHANVCKISTCMHTRCAMLIPKRIMKGKSPNPHLCSAESCQIRSSLPVHNRVWPFTLCGSAWRP